VKKIIPLVLPSAFVALCAVLTYIIVTGREPDRCWVVPDSVPNDISVYISSGAQCAMTVCEDTMPKRVMDLKERPRCWQMVEKRGKECESK
jgi:hypothetical protein